MFVPEHEMVLPLQDAVKFGVLFTEFVSAACKVPEVFPVRVTTMSEACVRAPSEHVAAMTATFAVAGTVTEADTEAEERYLLE